MLLCNISWWWWLKKRRLPTENVDMSFYYTMLVQCRLWLVKSLQCQFLTTYTTLTVFLLTTFFYWFHLLRTMADLCRDMLSKITLTAVCMILDIMLNLNLIMVNWVLFPVQSENCVTQYRIFSTSIGETARHGENISVNFT